MAKSLKDEILDDLIQDIQDVASVEIDDTFKEQLVFTSKDKWYNTFPLFYGYDYPEVYERRYNNKGFTLVELIVVIAVMAVVRWNKNDYRS